MTQRQWSRGPSKSVSRSWTVGPDQPVLYGVLVGGAACAVALNIYWRLRGR